MAESPGYLTWLVLALLPLYLLVCSTLRFRRRDALQKGFPNRASLARMTTVEAQSIVNKLAELEFPYTFLTSLQFALFKTYGIPSISKLLLETQQLCDGPYSSKRYTDTRVLIQEFSDHHPQSERTIKALVRMNYIHSRYQKAGKISNVDMLYTLSVFITEPISWVEKYEWREMTDTEKNALGTHWKSIGDAMAIDYQPLSKTSWVDGLEFYEDIKSWAQSFEQSAMVPATQNKKIADGLVPLLLYWVPHFIRPFATQAIGTVMGDRLRKAMLFPTPGQHYALIVGAAFGIRRFVLRHLCPPRPEFLAVKELTDADPVTGLYHTNSYLSHPYYIKPGFWNRWGVGAWFVYLSGGDLPGTRGAQYEPQGYRIEEVGPERMRGKGGKEMSEWADKLRNERPAGCPFNLGIK